jgi:hypothetical protein
VAYGYTGSIYGYAVQLVSGPLWFLLLLFIGEVGFCLLYKFCKGKTKPLIVTSFVLASITFVESQIINHAPYIWHLDLAGVVIMFITMGFLLNRLLLSRFESSNLNRPLLPSAPSIINAEQGPIAFLRKHLLLCSIVMIVCGLALTGATRFKLSFANEIMSSFWMLLVIPSLVSFGILGICMKFSDGHKLFSFVGKTTLINFGFQSFFCTLAKDLALPLGHFYQVAILAVVIFILMMGVCYLIHRFLPIVEGKFEQQKRLWLVIVVYLVLLITSCVFYMHFA